MCFGLVVMKGVVVLLGRSEMIAEPKINTSRTTSTGNF